MELHQIRLQNFKLLGDEPPSITQPGWVGRKIELKNSTDCWKQMWEHFKVVGWDVFFLTHCMGIYGFPKETKMNTIKLDD